MARPSLKHYSVCEVHYLVIITPYIGFCIVVSDEVIRNIRSNQLQYADGDFASKNHVELMLIKTCNYI